MQIEEKILRGEILSGDEMKQALVIPNELEEIVFEAWHDPFVKIDRVESLEPFQTADGKILRKPVDATVRCEKRHFSHIGRPSSTGGTYQLAVPRKIADPKNPNKQIPNPEFDRIVNAVQDSILFSVTGPAKHTIWRRDVVARLHFAGERGSMERRKALSLLASLRGASIAEVTDNYDGRSVLTADIDAELVKLSEEHAKLSANLEKAGAKVNSGMSIPDLRELAKEVVAKADQKKK